MEGEHIGCVAWSYIATQLQKTLIQFTRPNENLHNAIGVTVSLTLW